MIYFGGYVLTFWELMITFWVELSYEGALCALCQIHQTKNNLMMDVAPLCYKWIGWDGIGWYPGGVSYIAP